MPQDHQHFSADMSAELGAIEDGLAQEFPDLDWSLLTFSGHLAALSNLFSGLVADSLAELGLNSAEENVLGMLRSNVADTPSKLAKLIYQSPAGMTRTLDRLEKRGLVSRKVDPANLRQIKISLTRSGRKLSEQKLQLQLAALQEAFGDLDERSLSRIQTSVDVLLGRIAAARSKLRGRRRAA
jgi:DNA-binding MarR family transcriptional regulator